MEKNTKENTQKSLNELLLNLQNAVKRLLLNDASNWKEVYKDLSFVQKQTRYTDNLAINRLIVDKIVRSGIGHVFLKLWGKLSKENYLDSNTTDHGYCDRSVSESDHNVSISNDTIGILDVKTIENKKDNYEEEGEECFKCLQMLLSITWNCTDSNVSLCESLVRSACIYQFLTELSKPQLTTCDTLSQRDSLQLAKQTYVVKAYLGILLNITRHCCHSRCMFKTTWNTLTSLISLPNDIIKAKTYMLLAYIVSFNESNELKVDAKGMDVCNNTGNSSNNSNIKTSLLDVLKMADDVVAVIVSLLRDALLSHNHFSNRYAFWACEIASGLNHLAINDSNKVKLGSLGIFSLYVQMLGEGNDDEEKMVAASGIWILSFHPSNKRLLISHHLQTLREVAGRDRNEGVCRCLRGALWVLQSAGLVPRALSDDSASDSWQEHVMISYHWSRQALMLRVRDALIGKGYKVWIDVDNMKGSTLEAMALAVERSSVMLLALCQEYKESPNCRTEAEYAFRLRKDIIPLLTHEHYEPDGWLGILVGTKLYFDFSVSMEKRDDDVVRREEKSCMKSEEDLFELQIERLTREIGERGLRKIERKKNEMRDLQNRNKLNFNKESTSIQMGNVAEWVSGDKVPTQKRIVRVHAAELTNIASEVLCQRCAAFVSNPFPHPTLSTTCSSEVQTDMIPEQKSPLQLSPPSKHNDHTVHNTNNLCNFNNTKAGSDVNNNDTHNKMQSRLNGLSSRMEGEMRSWSTEDLKNWMEKSKVPHLSNKLQGYAGSNIIQLRRVQVRAPEFFYNFLLNNFQLDMLDILSFSELLESVDF